MVRSRSGLSLGFLICSRELVSQGSGVGRAGTKGLVLQVCNESNLLPGWDPDSPAGEVPVWHVGFCRAQLVCPLPLSAPLSEQLQS